MLYKANQVPPILNPADKNVTSPVIINPQYLQQPITQATVPTPVPPPVRADFQPSTTNVIPAAQPPVFSGKNIILFRKKKPYGFCISYNIL